MLPLKLVSGAQPLKILCLGAHSDDIEIGCGGTILRLCSEYFVEHVKWVVFTSNPVRKEEAKKSAAHFLERAQSSDIVVEGYRDSFLFQSIAEIKEYFEEIRKSFKPDVIFTHYRNDLHQDHRLLCELTWNTFRNHLILEYEIPKYDGDGGNPNFFVTLQQDEADMKVRTILTCFTSQTGKHWFDRETFYSIMRIRGMESAVRYAEAFYVRKLTI